jgi:hypothetical protein
MPTSLPYAYAHHIDEFRKGIDENGPYYQVTYLFNDWTQADDVANSLRGYTIRTGGATIRVPPHQHPLSPNLYCVEAHVEGLSPVLGGSSGLPNFVGQFTVTATYRGISYAPGGTPDTNNNIDPSTSILWATQELDYDTEVYTIPNHTFVYQSDKKKSIVPMTLQVPITVMMVTFYQLPYLPTAAIRTARGRVNNATFLGVASECLLFKGGRCTREFNTDGNIANRCTLIFHERNSDQGWNKVPRHDNFGTWDTIQDGSANKPYSTADFSPLIVL